MIFKYSMILMLSLLFFNPSLAMTTHRILKVSNDRVDIWETIIYPGTTRQLKLHRHNNDRILVALTDGILRIRNDKGKSNYLKLKQDNIYYFKPDVRGELHTDENISGNTIKILVINLKS